MAFRNIIVENPAHISVKNSQLVIRTDTEHSAALEDISALLLENQQTTITAAGTLRSWRVRLLCFYLRRKAFTLYSSRPIHAAQPSGRRHRKAACGG